MKTCRCSIVGPVCHKGRELFEHMKHARSGVVSRVPLHKGVAVLTEGPVEQNYQLWYDAYLAHLGVISWDEWGARHT